MKSLFSISLLSSLLFVAAYGDSKKGSDVACAPNAELNVKTHTVERSSEVSADKKITVYSDQTIKSEQITKIYLKQTKRYIEHIDNELDNEGAVDTAILDFVNMKVTDEDLSYSFAPENGPILQQGTVYRVNEAEGKKILLQQTNQNSAGYKVCAVKSFSLVFQPDFNAQTVQSDMQLVLDVAFSEAALKEMNQ